MQVGGNHYVRCSIQPWEIIERNELDFWEGNVVKYVMRYKMKGGIEDLLKAKHYLEYLINREEKHVQTDTKERLASEGSPWGLQDLRGSPPSTEEVLEAFDGGLVSE